MRPKGSAPQDDGLAKYAATLFKKSRSCVTRAKSRLSRASSSSWGLRRPLPGKAATGSPATSCFQRRNRFGVIPRSRATWAVGCLPAVTSITASCLNSRVNARRVCPMLTTSGVSMPHPFRGVHYFVGGSETLTIQIEPPSGIDTRKRHIVSQRRPSPWVGKAGQDPVGFVEGNCVNSGECAIHEWKDQGKSFLL